MGVKGLTTYINFNEDTFLKTYLLHDSRLVIDGHSLCAQLYIKLNCFSAFGGDYDKIASYTKKFFKNLKKCNVQPYVIFDGSYEQRKLKTVYNRLRSKISGASRLDPVTQGKLKIFPLLFRDVFIEVLIEMSVAFTVCEFEADDEIAAMARHLNCPVLSYDSDFFIFNTLYIPFNTLDLKPKQITVNDDTKYFALECKMYKVENLTSHFGGLKEDLVPLLGTLLGNDYVEKKVFNKFFAQIKLPKSKKKMNDQQRCIHGLFKWLQNETLDSAIEKILGRLKKAEKNKVLAIMKKSIEGYNNNHCESLKYFDIDPVEQSYQMNIKFPEGLDLLEKTEGTDTESISDESCQSSEESSDDIEAIETNNGLPNWFSEKIRLNKIPKNYINLYTHHLYFCNPQAEDYSASDSFLHNLPLLRYAFDLMTDYTQDYCIYVCRENNNNYRRIFVDREYSIPKLLDKTFSELDDVELKSCFHHFLENKMELLDLELINLLPSNFQLFMIAVLWWVEHCEVPLGHVHSLFISYIMLDLIDERTGMFRGQYHFNTKFSKRIEEFKKTPQADISNDDFYLNKNKIQYEDCLITASVLLKHFELDETIQKRPRSYDVKKIHSFAQFQCTLLQINSLNLLCGCPFEPTIYSKCFNGTFVYNISVKIDNHVDPSIFFEQYLKGAETVLMYYKSLVKIYSECAEKMNLSNIKSTSKRRRRKKKVDLDETDSFFVGLESEVVI